MKKISKNNFYIITGGPGVGKTTLIQALQDKGYSCVAEVARKIIKQQIESAGNALPWSDTKEYSKLMLTYSIRDFIHLQTEQNIYFFDRGIPDTYGYEMLMHFGHNPVLENAVRNYRYNQNVFILPPWEEIYETDNERKQSFDMAVETYHIMKIAYQKAGYHLIEIPCTSPTLRAEFIIRHV